MRVEVVSLCDAATTDNSGKLNILGAFDTIWAPRMPTPYPQCSIALRIRFEGIERGEHRVIVNFVDSDGGHIIPPVNGGININFPDEQRSGSANLILNIQQLRIERYGEYAINLAIDGRVEASLPLFIRERR
ncbi:MAG: hypothetical protein HY209_03405 [Candidatus Omnitrophica bacterium]|nr:hypothetical protein [Candidatus Omnitrophota bacterium]